MLYGYCLNRTCTPTWRFSLSCRIE